MNLYKLDDKTLDETFLHGEPVLCKAVLSASQQREGKIKEGDSIVIMLSNGAKYKGKIIRFNHVLFGGYAVGEIEVVRL